MNKYNQLDEENCLTWIPRDELEDGKILATFAILGVINVVVIAGNLLVIAAVFASSKLRTVTNFFIVSLAVADLLVGVAVLPYSITQDVLKIWIFGKVWCQIWLAVDVWMCTSSILNLCAISVDRYLAITRPVHYRSLMSSFRAKLMIAVVWVLSFIICFPPLVGWNDDSQAQETSNQSSTLVLNLDLVENNLTEIVPQFLSSGQDDFMDIMDDRGEGNETSPNCDCALINNKGYVIYSALGSFYIPMLIMLFFYWKIYVAALRTSRALKRGFKTTKTGQMDEPRLTLRIHRGNPEGKNVSGRNGRGDIIIPRKHPSGSPGLQRTGAKKYIHFTGYGGVAGVHKSNGANHHIPQKGLLNDIDVDDSGKAVFARLSKRNVRWHARRFRSEAKATKTVGIIVGGFIFCWLPFFTVYLIRAFCEDCVSNLLLSIFVWLGYCNSAANPIIYGLFSKDFRQAFKKVVCRCFIKDEGISTLIKQIHMPTFFEENQEEPELT